MINWIVGTAGFAYSFYFVANNHGDKFSGFFDKAAFVLLLVAPISTMLLSHNFKEFLSALKCLLQLVTLNQKKEMNLISNALTSLSASVRSTGYSSLIAKAGQYKNPLLRDGLSLIINGFTEEEIRHNITAKINTNQTELHQSANFFDTLSRICPGMGLVGTIIGLVQMLSNLSDPSKIGGGMAVSLLATLYGLIFGTVIYGPIGEKLKNHSERVLQIEQMILDGVLILKNKKSSAHVKDIVKTYNTSMNFENEKVSPEPSRK